MVYTDHQGSIVIVPFDDDDSTLHKSLGTMVCYVRDVQLDAAVVVLAGPDNWSLAALFELRSKGASMPVLVLRRYPIVSDSSRLLNAGADACLDEKASILEKEAVLLALMRRGPLKNNYCPQVGLLTSRQTLLLNGVDYRFGPVAFRIVKYLVENVGRYVSAQELLREAIGTHHRSDSSIVRFHVYAIRKALGSQRQCIRGDGRRGSGYSFELAYVANGELDGAGQSPEMGDAARG